MKQTEMIELTDLAPRRRPAFGEFLVEQQVLDRFQLLRALQLQDWMPRARLGQCAVALGYVPRARIEALHQRFAQAAPTTCDDDLETMTTEAFHREPDIEIVRG